MYVDSNDTSIPAGDQTVAQFMRETMEDLLVKVRNKIIMGFK
jgi:hypothetical protein